MSSKQLIIDVWCALKVSSHLKMIKWSALSAQRMLYARRDSKSYLIRGIGELMLILAQYLSASILIHAYQLMNQHAYQATVETYVNHV